MRLTMKKSMLCSCIAIALLSGCGGGGDESTSSPTSTGSVSPTNINFANSSITVNEGDEGERPVGTVTVRLSKIHDSDITLSYQTNDSANIAGVRYQDVSGEMTFVAGEREKRLEVTLIGNNTFDPDESFTVDFTLGEADNVNLINERVSVVINDDDPEPTINMDIGQIDVREGVGIVDVWASLDRASYREITANLEFSGLASNNNDYRHSEQTITFTPYTDRAKAEITILEDDIIEGAETIDISMRGVSNADVGELDSMRIIIQGDLRLNDTGVLSHFNNGDFDGLVPDGDHPNQDADYGLDTDDRFATENGHGGLFYNKIDNAGNALPASATGHECTFDAHTGLTWEIKGPYFYHEFAAQPTQEELEYELDVSGQYWNNRNGRYRYYNENDNENGGSRGGVNDKELANPVLAATGVCMFPPRDHPLNISSVTRTGCTSDKYIQIVNKSARCGFVDWRLPTINELQTLVIYEDERRGFDQSYFPDTRASEATHFGQDFVFLSSTPAIDNDASVWCFDVATRQVQLCNKTEAHHVRLVRGNTF